MNIKAQILLSMLLFIPTLSSADKTDADLAEKITRLNWIKMPVSQSAEKAMDEVNSFKGLIDSSKFLIVDSLSKAIFSQGSLSHRLHLCLQGKIKQKDAMKILKFYSTDLGMLIDSLYGIPVSEEDASQLMMFALADEASIDSTLLPRFKKVLKLLEYKESKGSSPSFKNDSTAFIIASSLNRLQKPQFRLSEDELVRKIMVLEDIPETVMKNFASLYFLYIHKDLSEQQLQRYMKQEKKKHIITTDEVIRTCLEESLRESLEQFKQSISNEFEVE